jgi:nucleoside-diphosphate-sugar epimerase
MEKVIVTGGAGFIGSHLVNALIKEGFEVSIIDNFSTGKKENINPKAKFFNLDVRNLEDIKSVFSGAKYVFHLAAIPSVQYSIEFPKETNEINAVGTLNVLIAAKDAGVKRVILSSSCSIYGDADKLPTDERSEAKPKSPYALHKYISEQYCKLFSEIYNLETVCLRYFNVYGPGQSSTGAYASVIAKFLDMKNKNMTLTITGDGMQTRDYVNVSDVVNANILASRSARVGKGEVINIGAGKSYSVNEIAALIGGPSEFIASRIEPKNVAADITLAKSLLNWESKVTFENGMKELLQNS